ncbi:RagB/SusD family nutrient uptake outer membrane protein [Geofilum sp. OHC36d9]|uniref:RagB/SusD family nutrient uptake outer membrane protein n=1 Tax=Geofilum sp. OHC36d9 TaxID=3458413 RepID=UPI004033828D
MNSNKIFLFSILLSFMIAGCSDYLDQDNRSNVPQSDFYGTEDGFTSLINSAYSSLRTTYGGDPWVFCAGTDLFASGRTAVDDIGLYGSGYNNTVSSISTFYSDCYSAISLANDVIYYGNIVSDFAEKDQYIDEARFLRAYYYFLLVEQFGDVVLIKERISGAMPATPRTEAEEVYQFIIDELSDLSGSGSALLDKATDSNFGHADKRAAMHFLAKAYLSIGYLTNSNEDFNNARLYSDQVIAASDQLTLPFAELMDIDNEQNDEIIFSVVYSETSVSDPSSDGSKQQAHFSTYLDGPEAGHKYCTSTLTPTLRMHQLFADDPNDERYEGTFMVTLYNHYFDYYNADLANTKVFAYYPPEWLVSDTAAWRAADPENRADSYIIPMTESGPNFNKDKSAIVVTSYEDKMVNDVFGVSCFKKFDDKTSAKYFSTTCSMRDVYLARLSETYLIAAEALIKAGKPGEAVPYVNAVRTRAKASEVATEDMTIDFILDERARELAGENHRWVDLKRTGKLIDNCLMYNPDINSSDLFVGADGQQKLLRPIPLSAMELNEALTQNPGFTK